MFRTAMILAAIAIAVTTVGADDFVVIRTSVPETTGLVRVPLLATTNADGLRQATGLAELPEGALYAQEMPSARPVEMQLTLGPGGQAEFAGLLPTDPPGPREIRVWLQNPPAAPPAPPLTISAERAGEIVRVRGDTFQVVHDPAVNAGILSQITFAATDKVFVPQMNDRVHSKQIGGYALRKDPDATVTLVADGPYMAEVRIAARYMGDGGATPETEPRATYVFRYWAGLPIFSASAQVEQDAGFAWDELHFLEIYFQDESFTQFAAGSADALTDFADDSQGTRAPNWGALIDGENVLGLTGSVLIYDGLQDYGRYLHGPWVIWDTDRVTLDRWLLVSAQQDALQTLDAVAGGTVGAGRAVVMTEGLLAAFDDLDEIATDWAIRSDQRGMLRGALRWRIALLRAALEQGQPLNEVLTAARELQGLAAGNPSAAASWTPPSAEGTRLLADDMALGVGLLQTDTGIELTSLYDMVAGREMLAAPSQLFRIALTDAERNPASLGSSDGWGSWRARSGGTVVDARPTAQIEATFEGPVAEGLRGITATVTCEISGGESRWRLSVDNDTAWSIDRVIMPSVSVRALGDTGLDDTLYVPHGFGRGFPGGTGTRYTGYYPSGSCALPLLLVTDERGGVYLAAHDPAASTRNMVSSSGSAAGGVPLSIDTPAPDASVAGNDFTTSGEMVIARVDGGWYPATQKYRAWLQQNAPWWPEGDPDYGRDDRPAWLNDVAAWVLYGGGPETVVEPTQAFAEYMGLPVAIHWYNWHQIPFDNDYPHYFPTREGFAEGVAELQADGVRITPYINGRLWDTDTQSFQDEGYQYCTRDRDGEPYIEVYGSGEELAPMCISQQLWRDTLHEIVMRLMTEVNVDGVYMDQIAAARPRLCYDAGHGHPLAGGHWWVDGYWELLERIQTDSAAVGPAKMLTTESNAESYARWFDTYLMCNSLGDGLVPIFPAVYGSKILGFGRYMSNADWDVPESLAQKQGQLFVWGTQLWWSSPQVIDHAFAGPWLRDLARVRYRVREFFNDGRMLAPPTLEGNDTPVTADWHRNEMTATTPAVLATVWGLPDGRLLVPLINCSQEPQTVTLAFDPRDYGLAAAAQFTVQRLAPEATEDLGAWEGAVRSTVELQGVEAAALILTPER